MKIKLLTTMSDHLDKWNQGQKDMITAHVIINRIYIEIEAQRIDAQRELLAEIKQNFDPNHFCDCEKWCNCWKEFKKKILKNES